ncbi:MAG: hypothetical protein NC310_08575 [Roseburia sp.]|nr:hypothetical protein [Anaeroplasma bactoclasticum]MCM1197102.1 hypothetical protein [Roseburia sp.]MCM1556382.1 hypothetical protein [Anaeroplasma bactoclasticum]
MKKTKLCIFAVLFLLCLSLSSCGLFGVNYEKYAKQLDEEIYDGDATYPSYSGIMKKLGDEAIDCTFYYGSEANRFGNVVAVKGCKSREEILDKINNGETVEGIKIYIMGNVARSVKYTTITAEDIKDISKEYSDIMNGN